MAHNHIQTEKIDLHEIPMRQRKHIGMLCQRHMESKSNPGTIASLCSLLREYISTHEEDETIAVRWMLARISTDPLAEVNCRSYICTLLYD